MILSANDAELLLILLITPFIVPASEAELLETKSFTCTKLCEIALTDDAFRFTNSVYTSLLLCDIVVSSEEEINAMVDASDADVLLIELFAAAILSETVDNPLVIELAREEETVFIVEYTEADTDVNELLNVSIVAAAEAELVFIVSYTTTRLSDIEDELAATSWL